MERNDLADAAAFTDALKRDKLQGAGMSLRPPVPAVRPPSHLLRHCPAVIELYSDWAGPTQALPNFWHQLAKEHDSVLPVDACTACFERCKEAPALASLQATSQPRFLLFKVGKQVAFVKGVDPPGLSAAISKQLAAQSGSAAARTTSDLE